MWQAAIDRGSPYQDHKKLDVIGTRIQAERLRQNLTQEMLFLSASIDRSTLQALEGGRGDPTITTLLKIAYVLDVPLAYLVG